MLKDLTITLEEECIDCPLLELETTTYYYIGGTMKTHQCRRLQDCKKIRNHWEEVYKQKSGILEDNKLIFREVE